ncbi:hypothetical protein AM1_A0088 (plasmid) [Acaryochloris marina MBIC11017]|uniref:Uncharacterized protein n=1 Tax=Acaryochloris marina (strain MBIC 11017) TaxID=329726 RepID=A8ZK97_ACAM1|nr:hypothetical protein AM1_A0088 [Acaryochloris marina MBIC11017]
MPKSIARSEFISLILQLLGVALRSNSLRIVLITRMMASA